MLAHPAVPVAGLAEHVHALRESGGARFAEEYESIEPGQTFTWDHSSLEVNRGKNRYANVVAYDHSRVVLQVLPNEPGSDYINANYCDGYRRRDAYIATQGPMPNTFIDFWRMMWESGASVVAMVTRLEERARVKCHQYWPERGTEHYGPCTVTAVHCQELAHYTVRTFSLKHESGTREIRQLQFTSWPDHGVPAHPAPFLLYLRRLRALRLAGPLGPIVVHCSAGVGRTGCFIVLDAMLERLQHESTVDVYGHVTCLRAQRNYMVQTEEQYMFIHDALLEAVLCGQTEVPARALQSAIHALEAATQDGGGQTGMDLEFKRLNAMQMPDVSFAAASMEVNRSKNRLAHAVPYDHSRVILSGILVSEPGSDYINASFLDGYRSRHAYIATQGPLAHTVAHFWRMMWQHNCAIIVMLTKLKEQGQDKCAQYWPAERALRYGALLVEPLAEYNLPSYTLREFKVSDDTESRTIRQFQLSDWPGDALIDFIGQVHKTKEQFGHDGPIAVHCSGGVGRTGVFVALAVLLERMQWEGVVDVMATVRLLRTQRPAMVSTLEQYRLLYQSSLQYLSSFDHYAT